MQIRKFHRVLAVLLALVMVVGILPAAAFARAVGNDGSAEMNEAYGAKESLMPIGPSFNVDTLLEWTPEADPDARYSRASIPLANRVGGFVVNPLVNPEAKLMLCSLANSDHDNTSAQGTESFLSWAFNYWQYAGSFVYWSGSEEGLVVVPTGEFTDAAHTNGVPVVATLGFPWGSGDGFVEQVQSFVRKAADGTFPVADKLIELMDYYGFDGYFFNQESYGCGAREGQLIDEMMRYMHQQRPDMLISWYDSMLPSGGVSYQDAITDANKAFMKDSEDGTRAIDEFLMNYNWTEAKVNTTISTMKSVGRSPFDAFAGLDVQQNCMKTPFRDHLLVDEDGLTRLSIALYCPNSTLGLSKDGEEFHKMERQFYTNGVSDPRDTSVDLTTNDWAGMSRFFADHTAITKTPFVTDFNSGHGRGYFVDGQLSRDGEWSYHSNQDIMPTWTWIIDSEGQKLNGDYDFSDAWNGGNSIKFHGGLTANKANDILLYSTMLTVTDTMELGLTCKGDQGKMKLVAYYGDSTTGSYEECEQVAYALSTGDGWTTTNVDISAQAGKTLYAIGLKIESAEDVADYQVNLGRLTILDETCDTVSGPGSITLDEIMYKDAYTAEARIFWEPVEGASSYEIYKVNGDGSKTLIMETPNTAYYVPTLSREAGESEVKLEIVALNRSGIRGEGTELAIHWAYADGDTEAVVAQSFENVCLNAPVTGVSFQNDGEPASKALDGTSANNSKWCATNKSSGWMSIDIGREVTVRRWRMEHAEYGGEANNMNTPDFALEYKNAAGEWVQAMRIQNNTRAVTDVLLDEPVTAREWKLVVYKDGYSPWGGIRIYEWQMFEVAEFPQTAPVPMHFVNAVNGEGADDTVRLSHVTRGHTVRIYTKDAEEYTLIGETTASGSNVVLADLDFGTAAAGRVYYSVTDPAAAESAKLSVAFEAENAGKSAAAEDVTFEKYSHPGSNTSSNGADIFTTVTVDGLEPGDVVYIYENGADAPYSKASLPVTEGETSVSIRDVRVVRAGDRLPMQVKRVGCLISDVYEVESPAFAEPTAFIHLNAVNKDGEALAGVHYAVIDKDGGEVDEIITTAEDGGTAEVELGTYTLKCTEVPKGYDKLKATVTKTLVTEGATYEVSVSVPDYKDPLVTAVRIDPAAATMIHGQSMQLNAVVEGEGYFDEEVIWSLSGNTSEQTTLADGLLTVSEDETAETLTITAASAVDETKVGTCTITVLTVVNVAPNSSIWAYDGSKMGAADGPEKIYDGDYTTRWYETRNNAWVAIDLGAWYDVMSVQLYHAGFGGEDSVLNTNAFNLYTIPADDGNLSFWERNGMVTRNYYFGSDTYLTKIAAVSKNTDDVTTVMFDEVQYIRYLIIRVIKSDCDMGASGSRLYEVRVLADAPELMENAAAVEALIDAITTADDKIAAGLVANEAYLALTPAERALVKNYSILDAVLADIARPDMKDALRAYYEEVKASDIYSENGEKRLSTALDQGLALIDEAVYTADLDAALAQGKALLDAVPTLEEEMESALEEANKAVLAAAKYYANVSLSRIDLSGLNAYQKAHADAILDKAYADIEKAESVDEVEAILAAAKEAIAGLEHWVCAAEEFSDVSLNDWFHEDADFMLNNGYMNGYPGGTFRPDVKVSRAQLVTILYRVAGEPEVSGEVTFSDVAEDYYTSAVIWAADFGITTGYTDGTFRPNAEVSRQELVTFLYRFAEAEAVEEDHLTAFPDADKVADYAVESMNWAIANGIVSGAVRDNVLVIAPEDTARRDETCAIVARYMNAN